VTPEPQQPSSTGHGSPFPGELDLAALRAELKRAVAQACPRWMADRSEDVLQATLLRVEELSRNREGEAWLSSSSLRKAAYSAVIDEIRRLRHDPPAEEPDPERATASRQVGRAIQECLGTLATPRCLAVTLNLQGHSVPEVGRLMDWSTRKAENLVYRGMADLRRCLDGKGVVR